jgi:arylsulfatase A-like enzyme
MAGFSSDLADSGGRGPALAPRRVGLPGRRKPIILALLVAAAGVTLFGCSEDAREGRPNVLLITIDTLRADYVGSYGSPDVQTPHMDQLAAQGVQFQRNVAPSQCTNPSHASILTGLYLARHRVVDNQTPLPKGALTLAEILKTAGYETLAAVSARHLNPGVSRFDQGFDAFLDCEPVELTAGRRNEAFLHRLRQIADRPFFAWVHYFDPHGDYAPPPPYDTRYPVTDRFPEIPYRKSMDVEVRDPSQSVDPDRKIALYKGEISYLDAEIGEVLAALERLKIADRTLVVLVADHGESMTEKDIFFCHAGMYNQVLHVPLVMRFPGVIPAGTKVDALTSSIDILPTVLDLLGLAEATPEVSGRSLKPALFQPDARIHDAVFSEAADGVIRAVYADGYKYVKPYPHDWSMPEDRLFRAFTDYREERDLKHEEEGRVVQLQTLLDSWLAEEERRALDSDGEHELDAETEEALRSLGYID